jgi:adenosylcobinamide amidohydrolase/AraC-like DNA-binding protein
LTAVFNNCCIGDNGDNSEAELKAPTYAEHNTILSRELGLDPEKTAGMITAAGMEGVSIKTESYKDISVTAVVTGSLETNGGRAGDPASWDELAQKDITEIGTINIMLFINVDLTDGALTRSLITCTEAKTAALQELLVPSCYSTGLATGSGTDSVIIVCNTDSDIKLTDAGNHVKLGECIGLSVKAAVKETLFFQSGLSPDSQNNIFGRTSRFGITPQTLWEKLHESELSVIEKTRFDKAVDRLKSERSLVAAVSLYVHLLDQLGWGLMNPADTIPCADLLLKQMNMGGLRRKESSDDPIDYLVSELSRGLLVLIQGDERDTKRRPWLLTPSLNDLSFQFLDLFPYMIEIFAPDGTAVFLNRAGCEDANISNASEIVGHYNILYDKVVFDALGHREIIERAFQGERITAYNVRVPHEDTAERYTKKNESFNKILYKNISCFPLWDDKQQIAYVVMVFITTRAYTGRQEMIKAQEYINENWFENFNREKIAEAIGISPYHFSRMFNQFSGMTPNDYYRQVKIGKIQEKLCDPNLTVAQAFAECGVDSKGKYHQYFKEITEMTPTEYRKKHMSPL